MKRNHSTTDQKFYENKDFPLYFSLFSLSFSLCVLAFQLYVLSIIC